MIQALSLLLHSPMLSPPEVLDFNSHQLFLQHWLEKATLSSPRKPLTSLVNANGC